jgi:CheY-like chemotaxis protein
VVDDNAINRELAFELLTALGARVTLAEDGAEVLPALGREDFDAVLMDGHMPVLDGYETTRAIRRQPQYKELPIIAMTASASSTDRLKALAAGMNDQIAKPIDTSSMLDTLQRWCPRVE